MEGRPQVKSPSSSNLGHPRKARPEVLNALVLRIFLSCGLDFLFSLLADQSRRYQNRPAPRAGCLVHSARFHFPDRVRPPLDNSHPAALALPPALAGWVLALLAESCRHDPRSSVAVWAREHLGRNWSRSVVNCPRPAVHTDFGELRSHHAPLRRSPAHEPAWRSTGGKRVDLLRRWVVSTRR